MASKSTMKRVAAQKGASPVAKVRMCPNGHVNPVDAAVHACSECGLDIRGAEAVEL